MKNNIGKKIYDLIKILYPFCRSLTGEGNEKTLNEIKKIIPKLKILKFKSGTKVFDWKVPDEWNIKDAYIICPDGKRVAKFKDNNLHVVNYSMPINRRIDFKNLKKKIYFNKNLPSAIPYVTSYYEKDWGFCLSYNQFKKLKSGNYKVIIDSKFNKKGNLVLGEYFIKGKSKKEILISTYICHPSMANNELSGPLVWSSLYKILKNTGPHEYSYRFLICPENIGSAAFLHYSKKKVKKLFVKLRR